MDGYLGDEQCTALLEVAKAAALLFSSSRKESEHEVWVRLYEALRHDDCPVEVEISENATNRSNPR